MPDPASRRPLLAHLRVKLGTDTAIGPGKADLLEAIRDTGSIAAGGRRMGMSYKRAWELVRQLNAAFREPLVVPAKGGAHGGGATLTPLGGNVLAAYRRMQAKAEEAIGAETGLLRDALAPEPMGSSDEGSGVVRKAAP